MVHSGPRSPTRLVHLAPSSMTITDRDLLQGVVRGWHDRLPDTVNTVKVRAVKALAPGLSVVQLVFTPVLVVLARTSASRAVSAHRLFA